MSLNIVDVRTTVVPVNHRGDWVFVHIDTDSGISGLGEASHSTDDQKVVAKIEALKQELLGKDPRRINEFRYSHRDLAGRVDATAVSAIEQALWDIVGQHLGVPIHALFGGKIRDRVKLYANINRSITDRSPKGFSRAAAAAVEDGFTAIKIAPFDEVGVPGGACAVDPVAFGPGLNRVAAVREAIGVEAALAVDCHGRMNTASAVDLGKRLEEYGLFWYEEAIPYDRLDGLTTVSSSVNIPTASAESVFGVSGFAPFIQKKVVDVLMPDVKHCGGIAELNDIAGAARGAGLRIAPHNPSGPVATAASGHAVAGMDNFMILEYAWGEVAWRADLLDPPERIENGQLIRNDRPGLGHSLNPDAPRG